MTERDDHDFARRVAEPLREPEHLEPNFEARIHAAVRAAVARGEVAPARRRRRGRRSLAWIVAPRRFSMSPLAGFAAAAGFAALVASATLALSRDDGVAGQPTAPQGVQFAIVAPTANRVSLVGDFNGWDASSTLLTKGAVEGLWTVTLPLGVGTYQYAFVIDGETWVSDPAAPLALEDEFGAPSSLLTIRTGRT